MKPLIETLRVTNPVRQSRASGRKRVLRGGRATVSADREIKRCVIGPRNFLVVSLRLGQSRGPRQADLTPTQISCLVAPGSENMANDHEGFPGTSEILTVPLRRPDREQPVQQTPG